MTNHIPVEGKSGFYRDSESTAIINKDKKAKTATLLSFIKLPFVYVNRTHFQ